VGGGHRELPSGAHGERRRAGRGLLFQRDRPARDRRCLFSGFTQLVQIWDLFSALAKAFVFGGIAAMVSCYKGLYCKGGPKGVGDAVNQGVVVTFILIFFVNFVMTMLYFALVPQKF
jgi:ABC-type transporter Mla maintaining outer membrane lipid asymmetry permease subunit MlaE